MALTLAERRLRTLLRVLVVPFCLAGALRGRPLYRAAARVFFGQLPFVSNSAVKVSVMALVCLYRGGCVRRRWGGGDRDRRPLSVDRCNGRGARCGRYDPLAPLGARHDVRSNAAVWRHWSGQRHHAADADLLSSVLFPPTAAAQRSTPAPAPPPAAADALTAAERRMRLAAIGFGALFALAAIGYEAGALLASTREFFIELPFVTNSVVKVGTLALLCFYVARDIRANLPAMGLVIVAHIISPLAQIAFFATDTSAVVTVAGQSQTIGSMLWTSIVLDGVFALVLFILYQAAWTARFSLQFFRPIEYRTLAALSEVLVRGDDERVPAPRRRQRRALRSKHQAHRRWV